MIVRLGKAFLTLLAHSESSINARGRKNNFEVCQLLTKCGILRPYPHPMTWTMGTDGSVELWLTSPTTNGKEQAFNHLPTVLAEREKERERTDIW